MYEREHWIYIDEYIKQKWTRCSSAIFTLWSRLLMTKEYFDGLVLYLERILRELKEFGGFVISDWWSENDFDK